MFSFERHTVSTDNTAKNLHNLRNASVAVALVKKFKQVVANLAPDVAAMDDEARVDLVQHCLQAFSYPLVWVMHLFKEVWYDVLGDYALHLGRLEMTIVKNHSEEV